MASNSDRDILWIDDEDQDQPDLPGIANPPAHRHKVQNTGAGYGEAMQSLNKPEEGRDVGDNTDATNKETQKAADGGARPKTNNQKKTNRNNTSSQQQEVRSNIEHVQTSVKWIHQAVPFVHTAFETLKISIRWKVGEPLFEIPAIKFCHPSKFQFAFTCKNLKDLTINSLKENGININGDIHLDQLSLDVTTKNFVAKQDAADFVNTLFREKIFEFISHEVFLQGTSNYENIEKNVFIKGHSYLTSEHVMCFESENTGAIHFVGEVHRLNSFFKDLNIKKESSSLKISCSDWNRFTALGLQQQLNDKNLKVEFVEPENAFKIDSDEENVQKAKMLLDSIVTEKVEWKNSDHEQLLKKTDGTANDNLIPYFQKMTKKVGIETFVEVSVEKGNPRLYISCLPKDDIKGACDIIRNCITDHTFVIKQFESVQDVVDSWMKRNKLKILSKTESKVKLISTADVAEELNTALPVIEEIELTPVLSEYLITHGKDILKKLKKSNNLLHASVDNDRKILQVEGRLSNITRFKGDLASACEENSETFKLPQSILGKCEDKINAIVNGHQCCCVSKILNSGSVAQNSPTVAVWRHCDHQVRVELYLGILKDIDAQCKVLFVSDSLAPLQIARESELDEQRNALKPSEVEIGNADPTYRLGQVVWQPQGILSGIIKKSPVHVGVVIKTEQRSSKPHRRETLVMCEGLEVVFAQLCQRKLESVAVPLCLINDVVKPAEVAEACIKTAIKVCKNTKCFQIYLQCSKDMFAVVEAVEKVYKSQPKKIFYREQMLTELKRQNEYHQITVKVKTESLLSLTTDVVVNTVAPDLDLRNGYLSNQILKRAGQDVQNQCWSTHPKGMQEGKLAVTGSGKLQQHPTKVRNIFHCALPDFEKHNFSENVKKMVTNCLIQADIRRLKTIAFPAFGTGKLEYPVRDTAQAMFDAVKEYQYMAINSVVTNVVFAVHSGDKDTVDAFCEEERRRKTKHSIDVKAVGGYNGYYADVGANGRQVKMHIAAKEDVIKLPSHVVKVFIMEKRTDGPKLLFKLASEDPVAWNDQLFIHVDSVNDEEISATMKLGWKQLLMKRVTDIVIYSPSEIAVSAAKEVQIITDSLQEHLKEYGDKWLRDVVLAFPRNLMTKLLENELLVTAKPVFLGSVRLGSLTSKMSGKVQWSICKAEDIPIKFIVVGEKESATTVIKELTKLFYMKQSQSGDDDYEEINVDSTGDANTEQVSQANEDVSKEIRTDIMTKDMVSAEVNPGIVHYLQRTKKFDVWKNEIEKEHRITVKKLQQLVYVRGLFDDMIKFEEFLEQYFATCHQGITRSKTNEEGKGKHVTEYDVGHEGFSKCLLNQTPCLTFRGFEVRIVLADITKIKVDCIVNATNEHLSDAVGVSKALSAVAGDTYKDQCKQIVRQHGPLVVGQCYDTGPGKLLCRRVFHARGPTFKEETSQIDALLKLQSTVLTVLVKADEFRFQSIALTAISSGSGGIDASLCAQEYFRAITEFVKLRKFLKYIFFVDNKSKSIQTLNTEFQRQYEYYAESKSNMAAVKSLYGSV